METKRKIKSKGKPRFDENSENVQKKIKELWQKNGVYRVTEHHPILGYYLPRENGGAGRTFLQRKQREENEIKKPEWR